jgi:hypothetical protein
MSSECRAFEIVSDATTPLTPACLGMWRYRGETQSAKGGKCDGFGSRSGKAGV